MPYCLLRLKNKYKKTTCPRLGKWFLFALKLDARDALDIVYQSTDIVGKGNFQVQHHVAIGVLGCIAGGNPSGLCSAGVFIVEHEGKLAVGNLLFFGRFRIVHEDGELSAFLVFRFREREFYRLRVIDDLLIGLRFCRKGGLPKRTCRYQQRFVIKENEFLILLKSIRRLVALFSVL